MELEEGSYRPIATGNYLFLFGHKKIFQLKILFCYCFMCMGNCLIMIACYIPLVAFKELFLLLYVSGLHFPMFSNSILNCTVMLTYMYKMYKLSSFSCVFYFSSDVSVFLVQKLLFSRPLAEHQLYILTICSHLFL